MGCTSAKPSAPVSFPVIASPAVVGKDTSASGPQTASDPANEQSVRSRSSWVKDELGFKQHLAKVSKFSQLDKKYELGELLGEGITGQVRLITSKIDGNVYAMKSLNVQKMDESQLVELHAEIEMLKHLDHPNIVDLMEVFESPNNICLVMEYCAGGDLSERRFKTENDLASVLNQILTAIAHCHHFGVIHRDLKMENIMFASKEKDYLRLIDFGLSKAFFQKEGLMMTVAPMNNLEHLNDRKRLMKSVCGTIVYMAPEVLSKSYSEKADVWAIGVIAFTLMTGNPPFQAADDRELIRKIKDGEIHYEESTWKRVTPAGRQFVQALLTVDPKKRPSAVEALRLPWLTNFRERQMQAHPIDPEFGKRVFKCLLKFTSYPLLRKAALMIISFHTSEQETFKLQRVFLSLDEQFTGELTSHELYKLIERYGDTNRMPRDRFEELFVHIDQDRTGKVHHMEFLAATIESIVTPSRKLLDQAFDHLDADTSGVISAENMMDLLGERYSEQDVKEILDSGFRSLGLEPQEEVTRETFLRMMEKVGFPSAFDDLNEESVLLASDETVTAKKDGAPPKMLISVALERANSSMSAMVEPLESIRENSEEASPAPNSSSASSSSPQAMESSIPQAMESSIPHA